MARRLGYRHKLLMVLGFVLILSPSLARAQCSAAFAGEAKAGHSFRGHQPESTDAWMPGYLNEEAKKLSDGFGFPVGVQFMDGAGACVNTDDHIVFVGRGLAARILFNMQTKLPLVMKRPEFADHDNVIRAGMRYVLAHETAHLFQNARERAGDTVPSTSAVFELQADCIAGLWIGYDPESMRLSGTPVIVATQVAAWVFGDEMGDFPTVGVPEKIDPTGHSTGVKRTSCVTSGIGVGRTERFGDRSTAFKTNGKAILDWGAEGAQHYLTPFEERIKQP